MRRLALLTVVVLLVLGPPGTPAAAYAPDPQTAAAEQVLSDQVNRARAAAGLSPAAVDPVLADLARAQAQRMRDAGRGFHNERLHLEIPRPWGAYAENVAWGSSLAEVEQLLLGSSPHRANILGSYDRVGVGVAGGADMVYVSLVFVRTR
ncbi:MAG: CAP domain-containing protein [Actinomycetota bacterium]